MVSKKKRKKEKADYKIYGRWLARDGSRVNHAYACDFCFNPRHFWMRHRSWRNEKNSMSMCFWCADLLEHHMPGEWLYMNVAPVTDLPEKEAAMQEVKKILGTE